MNDSQVLEENKKVLLNRWKRIQAGERDTASLGLNRHCIRTLGNMRQQEVERAADCKATLFGFSVPPDVLEGILNSRSKMGDICLDTMSFLIFRWSARTYPGSTQAMTFPHDLEQIRSLSHETVNSLQQAAASGINLIRLLVNEKYLFLASQKLNLSTSERTQFAILNKYQNIYN